MKDKNNRTLMYGYDARGEVVEHHLPFDEDDPVGRTKLTRFMRPPWNYTFDDPRAPLVTAPKSVHMGQVAVAEDEIPVISVKDLEEETTISGGLEDKVVPDVVDSLKCPDCDYTSDNVFTMKAHRTRKHGSNQG